MPQLILVLLSLSLFSAPIYAQDTSSSQTDAIYNQEEYERQRQKEIEEMQQALTAMSKFMVQTMNNMTAAINKSIPEIAKSSQELIQSIQPIIKAAEENASQVQQYNHPQVKAQNPVTHTTTLSKPTQNQTISPQSKPKRIKLFPDPSPNY